MQTAQQFETFTGVVEDTIPQRDIGWVRTDAGETLYFHRNYVRNHKLPEIGQRVKGCIGRADIRDDMQSRAFAVEVCND